MLSKIIVSSYKVLLEVSMWVILLAAFIGGWVASGFFVGLGALLGTFVICVAVYGTLFILVDIQQAVRAIADPPLAVVPPTESERLRSQFMLIERNMASIDNYMDVAKILGGSVMSNGFLKSQHYVVELDGVKVRIDNFESLRQWFLDNVASRVRA